jgi:hypothetical protein
VLLLADISIVGAGVGDAVVETSIELNVITLTTPSPLLALKFLTNSSSVTEDSILFMHVSGVSPLTTSTKYVEVASAISLRPLLAVL